MSFFKELRRRNVFRVAATYVVVSWVIMQVVSVVKAPLSLPDWFETVVVVLLAIGFLIALVLAWAFELTPDGIRPAGSDDPAVVGTSGNKLDFFLVGGLVIVAVSTIWGQVDRTPQRDDSQQARQGEIQSIAVLPFVDMSPDGDQEYFGDGIAEELLNELTRLDGLNVAGRTSSFSYKGSNEDLQAIGRALGVDTILEGSIRKDGDRARITAQLINTADGYHIWSQTYDRELADIFVIQEDIASSVAGKLGVALGVGGANAFRGAGTRNLEAYEAFLQDSYERAIELDPNYAAAWARLGVQTATTMWSHPTEDAPAIIERAHSHVQRAISLDPESSTAHSQFATLIYAKGDWIDAEKSFDKALSLRRDRSNLRSHANMLMRAGRASASRRRYSEADSVELRPANTTSVRINVSLAQGRYGEAKEMAVELRDALRAQVNYFVSLHERDPDVVRMAIAALPQSNISYASLYAPILGTLESSEDALSILHAVDADTDLRWPSKHHDIALLAAYFGDPQFALEVFSKEVRNTSIRMGALWYPVMSEMRQLPAFKQLVTDIQLVEYWRAYDWADFCRPVGDSDFTCN